MIEITKQAAHTSISLCINPKILWLMSQFGESMNGWFFLSLSLSISLNTYPLIAGEAILVAMAGL
jgi:hypothetical protein